MESLASAIALWALFLMGLIAFTVLAIMLAPVVIPLFSLSLVFYSLLHD